MSVSSITNRNQKKYRIVFLGDQNVGKTSIIQKYTTGKYDETHNSTVGIDFNVRDINHGGQNYRLQMWDTAGQQRYRSLIPTYLKNAHFAIFVYDITKPATLENIKTWHQLFRDHQDAPGLLVGNKVDLEKMRKVKKEEVQNLASMLKLDHIECSAKTGKKIDDLFLSVIEKISHRQNSQLKGQKYFMSNTNDKQTQQIPNQASNINSKKDSTVKLNKEEDKKQARNGGCC